MTTEPEYTRTMWGQITFVTHLRKHLLPCLAVALCVYLAGTSIGFFFPEEIVHKRSCFCELDGAINDCCCNVNTVDYFNNMKIYPRLKSILVKNYFRFYKVNLNQACPFWPNDSKCPMRFCQVQNCEENQIPEGIKQQSDDEILTKKASVKHRDVTHNTNCATEDDFNNELSFLDTSISDQAQEEFARWAIHDEAEEDFCLLDDMHESAQYVDLLLNPERFTGYKGDSAHRIWKSIYLENCFNRNDNIKSLPDYIPNWALRDVCLEQRAFYRLISGLHSSINIHLCSKYLLSDSKNFLDPVGQWGPNAEEFKLRFSPDTTNDEGPHWLRNLYFIYVVELRALAKAAPYLKREMYYTGITEEDAEVRLAIKDLFTIIESFQPQFDEKTLFSKGIASKKFKLEYKEKFRNISKIMDCVGCDKCKLWGKLQTQGLGTALKILYSEKLNMATMNGVWDKPHLESNTMFRLTRSEIVALFNAFGRLSTSIYEMENFRKLLR